MKATAVVFLKYLPKSYCIPGLGLGTRDRETCDTAPALQELTAQQSRTASNTESKYRSGKDDLSSPWLQVMRKAV